MKYGNVLLVVNMNECMCVYSCMAVYCKYPGSVKHGNVLLVGNMGLYDYRAYVRKVRNNRMITYKCDRGYTLANGPPGATCVNGRWRPSHLPLYENFLAYSIRFSLLISFACYLSLFVKHFVIFLYMFYNITFFFVSPYLVLPLLYVFTIGTWYYLGTHRLHCIKLGLVPNYCERLFSKYI